MAQRERIFRFVILPNHSSLKFRSSRFNCSKIHKLHVAQIHAKINPTSLRLPRDLFRKILARKVLTLPGASKLSRYTHTDGRRSKRLLRNMELVKISTTSRPSLNLRHLRKSLVGVDQFRWRRLTYASNAWKKSIIPRREEATLLAILKKKCNFHEQWPVVILTGSSS